MTVVKILSSNITCSRETVHERKSVDQFGKFYRLILRNCHSHLKPLATTSLISQQSSTQRQDLPSEKKKKIKIAQGSLTISIFLSNILKLRLYFLRAIMLLYIYRLQNSVNTSFICTGEPKHSWLPLLWYSLYWGDLELNPQYLCVMPIVIPSYYKHSIKMEIFIGVLDQLY